MYSMNRLMLRDIQFTTLMVQIEELTGDQFTLGAR